MYMIDMNICRVKEHKQKISIHVVSTCSKPSTKSTHNVKIQTITDNKVQKVHTL
jgi:hypothetical protein